MKATLKKCLLICMIAAALPAFSQPYYYWIKLKDKNNNPFSVNTPSAFLGTASIERRTNQNIGINESDLPLTPAYVTGVSQHVTRLVHRLKWFNMVVVEVDTSLRIDTILQLPYVEAAGSITVSPPNKMLAAKFETVYPAVDQQYIYPNQYGAAYRQTNMLNIDLLHQMGYRGSNVTIAMMDNGFVNVDWITGFDSVRPHILATWDFVHNDTNVYDAGGHGTSTFSCIAGNIPGRFLGTAPDADFYLLGTEDDADEWIMEEYNWAAAAEWADSAGAQVFSTSLGYTTYNDGISSHTYADLDGKTTVITRASNMAFGKGILVINSAGNAGGSTWRYIGPPADGDSVMAIGAVDSAETLAGFSSRGPTVAGRIKPDVCAQGVGSAVLYTGGEVGYSGGTSFSCPILAGSAACLWGAFPDKSAREIYDVIVLSADRFWSPNNDYGYGVPDFYTAYLLLKTDYNSKIIHQGSDITVFPNPFNNDLNISMYGAQNGMHTLEIFDMFGRKVSSKEIYIRKNSFDVVTLEECRNLAAGTYIIRWDGKKDFAHKVVKK